MPVVTESGVSSSRDSTSGSPVSRIGWVLPAFVLLLYALRPLAPVKDPDAYWHIVAGDHLLQTGEFVLDDPFGAATEKTWILNQWLPEVVMSWARTAYGLPGVAWLLCAASFLVGLSVYAACRRRSSPLVTAVIVTIVFVALSASLSPRPQLVTFALTAVTTSAWLRTREDGRARWWLVPLSWLWACSHGMWFVGPVVGGVVVVGLLLERRATWGRAVRLALIPALSVVVAALTPVGPILLTSPFQVGGVTAYITEWQRPGLAEGAVLAALALAAIIVMDQLRRGRRQWTVVLLTVLAVALALTWSRTVGLGAVVLAPLAAAALQSLTGQARPRLEAPERPAVAVAGVAGLVVAALLAGRVAAAPALGANGLDDHLSRLPAGTVVCNDQVDGGWLMFRHPGLRPTMDTRVELYTAQHITSYLRFIAAKPGWQSYIRDVGCTVSLLPDTAAVASALRATGDWQLVRHVDGYVLLQSQRDG